MKNDINTQFLCNDCELYERCRYYDNRKPSSYICKYFHITAAKKNVVSKTTKYPRETKKNEYIRFETARDYLTRACYGLGSNGGLGLKIKFDTEQTMLLETKDT